MFYIPIDDKIREFQIHIDSHPRTILSARFGDGKSFFLNKAKEVLREKGYEFITIHPIHYQVAKNEDIFNLIKRDILYQMLTKNMIKEDYEVSDSIAFSFYLQSKNTDIIDEMLSYLSLINNDNSNLKLIITALATHKLFSSLRKKLKAFSEEGRKDKAIESFLLSHNNDITLANDAIATIIRENLLDWEKTNDKKVILIFEDIDRIDPAHTFRIMNVLSAQMDYPYVFDTPVDEQTREDINQFGMYTILLVLHYENLKSIFAHFYGENTDFKGYLSKFSPRGYFKYSLSEERNKYIYEKIQEVTNMPIEIIKQIIKPDDLKMKDLRKIVNSFDNIDAQISPEAYVSIKLSTQTILCSAKILRVTVIARRLGVVQSQFITSCSHILLDNFSEYIKYFAICIKEKQTRIPWMLYIKLDNNKYIRTNVIQIDSSGDAVVECRRYMGVSPTDSVSSEELISRLFNYISQ